MKAFHSYAKILLSTICCSIFYLLLYTPIHAAAPSGSWWNNNYLYRQKIIITATAGTNLPKNYGMTTTIDTAALQTAGKVRSDRNDWHIVYWDEGTSTWTDLPRDYQNATTTNFLTQRDIPQGTVDDNYYAYYGYSGESTTPTSYFNDEFTSTTLNPLWTWSVPLAGPSYSLTANPGSFRISVPGDQDYDWWTSVNDAPKLSKTLSYLYDWTLTTKVTLANYTVGGSFRAGLYFPGSNGSGTCYVGYFSGTNIGYECLGNQQSPITYSNTTVYFRLQKTGTTYTVDYSSDGSSWTNITSETAASNPTIGLFSKTFSTPHALDVDFDYVRLSYTAKGTVTTGSERQKGASGSVSAANSLVSTASSYAVPNYGNDVYVTLEDQYGDLVSGKSVTLASNRSDLITQPSSTTDMEGRTYGTIYATSTGTSTITATDSTDSVTITQQPSLIFADKEPDGYAAFSNLANLIYLRNGVYAKQVSSYDRLGGNADGGANNTTGTASYLYKDGSNYVVLDEKSPGCLYDFWATSLPAGNVEFFFDGEGTASVNLANTTFWGGASSPFLNPITGDNTEYLGAYNSFFPMCFTQSLKVEFTQFPAYYHILYHTFATNNNVTKFSSSDSPTSLLNIFNGAGSDPKPTSGNYLTSGSVAVNAGQTGTIANLTLSGVIDALKLSFSATDSATIKNTYLKISFDGESTPSVNVPVSYFFGSGLNSQSVTSLMLGMNTTTNQYYSYWPMPFNSSANITINNQSSTNLTITYDVSYRHMHTGEVGTSAGYFKAFYNSEAPTTTGKDYTILNATGSGQFVGTVTTIEGNSNSYLEGNEHIYVDGSLTPQIKGTGTEDYFLGGFYFNSFSNKFSLALSGMPYGVDSLNVSMYRLHLSDLIPFQNSIIVGLEHGPTNNVNTTYNSVAFYYLASGAQLSQSDTLDVGNSTSETNHAYSSSGQTSATPSATLDYEASTVSTLTNGASVTDSCKSLNGYSQFTASINPNNNGVRLRRRSDQNIGNQQAQVYVDGSLVGTWYTPGRNSSQRWLDSDFDIPASFTSGKSSITVKIAFVSSDSDWNECYYWIYSFTNALVPIVQSVSATPTSNGASVTWNTNLATSSIIDYGLASGSYSGSSTETDTSTRVTSHSTSATGLVSCSLLHYRVRSKTSTGNAGTGSDGTFTTTGCTGSAAVKAQNVAAITTAAGGSINLLSSGKGIALTVPTAFSGSDATFEINQLDKTAVLNATSTPTGYSNVGDYVYELKALTDPTTAITSFTNPITVTMTYGASDVTGVDASSLKIFRWDGSTWNQLSGCSVDTVAMTVTCTTNHFSTFSVFSQNPTTSSNSSSSSNGSGSTPTPPGCSDQTPGSGAPWLYGALPQSTTSILLYFTPADNPVSKYVLEFGTQSVNYPYGVQDLGVNARSQMTYLVQALSPNTKYYFRIRAGNGCATGSWSNEISATTRVQNTQNLLPITASTISTQPNDNTQPTVHSSSCQSPYTVKVGDTLQSIATDQLGDGTRMSEIATQNRVRYPSLSHSHAVNVGWQLNLNCGSPSPQQVAPSTVQTQTQPADYSLQITVHDTNKKPVAGAKLTLHSAVQTAETDSNGIATFQHVESGNHDLMIAYNDYSADQSINLSGDVKEIDLNITIKPLASSPWKTLLTLPAIGVFGMLGLIIIGLVFVLVMKSRSRS